MMKRICVLIVCGVWACQTGCTLLKPQPAGEVLRLTEPDLGQEYYLYKPSRYKKSRSRPLLVLCHSSPWQSPQSVILDWAELAEERGLLLLAPKLKSGSDWPATPEKQLQRQEQDEVATLKALQHVRGAYRVAADKTFIVGSKAGCRPAMFTGLRNPDEFRLVALDQPRFEEAHLAATKDFLDPYQQVLVVIGIGDLARDQAKDCLQWLRNERMAVSEKRVGSSSTRHVERVYRLIRDRVAKNPWVRVRAFETTSPMRVKFQAVTSFKKEIYKYEWDFGDGSTGVVARPEHEYAQPGEYEITLKLYPDRDTSYERKIRLSVPADYRMADSE